MKQQNKELLKLALASLQNDSDKLVEIANFEFPEDAFDIVCQLYLSMIDTFDYIHNLFYEDQKD